MAPSSQQLVWFITGGSSGMGLALAQHVLSRNHLVIVTSRNPSKNAHLLQGPNVTWMALDLSSPSTVPSIMADAEKLHGRIDVLVNNAAYCALGAFEQMSAEVIQRQMTSLYLSPALIMQAVLPGMRTRMAGTIVNVSSSQGMSPSPACGAYAASKAALEAVSESVSAEVAPFKIRMLVVELGAFRTHFGANEAEDHVDATGEYAEEGHPVAEMWKALRLLMGNARGDPAKGAKAMWEAVVGEGETGRLIKEEGLLRLVLGPNCWKMMDNKVRTLRKTVDLEKDIAFDTDLDGYRSTNM